MISRAYAATEGHSEPFYAAPELWIAIAMLLFFAATAPDVASPRPGET